MHNNNRNNQRSGRLIQTTNNKQNKATDDKHRSKHEREK